MSQPPEANYLHDAMNRRAALAGAILLALVIWFALCLIGGGAPGFVVDLVGYAAADFIPFVLVPAIVALGLSPTLHFGSAALEARKSDLDQRVGQATEEAERQGALKSLRRNRWLNVKLISAQEKALQVAGSFAVVARFLALVFVIRAVVDDGSAVGSLSGLAFEPLIFVIQVFLLAAALALIFMAIGRAGRGRRAWRRGWKGAVD